MLREINKQLDKYHNFVSSITTGCNHNKEIPIGDNDDLNSTKVSVMHIASSIVSEQKEKERRQLNIMIENLMI